MANDADEERRLHAAASQSAQAIRLARQRAERDLIEAKEALERKTEELAHSLAMARATLESTTDGILVTDAGGAVTGFNRKFLEMWGLPPESVASGKHRELVAAASHRFADPAAFRTRIEHIYASAPADTYDLLELLDGRVVERFSQTQRIEERDVGRVWSFRDITETKRAEQRLREQTEWFRVTLGSIGDAVITVDTDCRITFLNPVAEELTGWPAPEAVGRPLADVMQMVNEGTRQPAENPIRASLGAGTVVALPGHTVLIRRDGSERPIEDSAAPIKNPEGAIIGAVMVFHDVADRRQKELALERSYVAEKDARNAAELASLAKDQFIAALSHELRTPLTPVLAILSSLDQDGALPGSLTEDLETVRRNVELEARLIDDLLDLTRITRGQLHLHRARVSAEKIIEDAIKTCLGDLEDKRLTLVRDFAEPHPTFHVDGARVTQILWNLLKNAIKFTPPEGTITVSTRIIGGDGDRQLAIEVRDTGIGIEPSTLERVFQAFEQADCASARQFGGLGLGLAISKAIAEAHGGTLVARSAGAGQGSTFSLALPCPASEESETGGSSSAVPPAPAGVLPRHFRILLVEDHADTAAVLARLLRRMGHDVILARTAGGALALADREMHGGGIDLVMSDLGLPDGSGQDVMRTLSSKYDLKGIALSGYGMESDLEQSMASGFSRHLVKPVNLSVLRATLTELLPG